MDASSAETSATGIKKTTAEKIKKNHTLLLWAVLTTLIVFITQGFLMALKGTVDKIISTNTTINTDSVALTSTIQNTKIVTKS